MYDLSVIAEGLAGILTPRALLLMVVGMAISSVFAALPGVGSLLFLSMVTPFAIKLPPYECIALVLGIATVSNTANTFSSVLISVPGSSGSQATVVDGYPMARNGEARRAFGAAFAASGMGAIFGAVVFVATLPLVRPLVLAVGSPELMMLVLWGLCAVALLGGKAPLKGLIAACIGLAIAFIGTDQRTAVERFTYDTLYLANGIHLIIVALGMFAVPELIALAVRGTSVSSTGTLGSGTMQGIKDAFRNWWLVVRCSTIGVWVGAMPGLGSSVADWFAYAHAVQSSKDKENFGKGDVRGVIAPESSNNAKEGGALIPTMMFGIPGSTSFALILFIFIAVGIQPGRAMLTHQLPYVYAMVGTLVLANLMATTLAIAASGPFARISLLNPHIIFPVTLVLCFIGAFSVNYSPEDLIALAAFSALGYIMRRYDWPRPPVLLAVVLGPQFESYLWLSWDRYGYELFTRPGVHVVLGLIIVSIFLPVVVRAYRSWQARAASSDVSVVSRPVLGDVGFLLLVLAMFAYGVSETSDWPERAGFGIYAVAGAATVLGLIQLALHANAYMRAGPEAPLDIELPDPRREIPVIAWVLGFMVACTLFGLPISFTLFPLIYILIKGGGWKAAIFCSLLALGILLLVFEYLIKVVWPEPILWTLIKGYNIW